MDELIKDLRLGLQNEGFYHFEDPDGGHVCISVGKHVGIEQVGIMVAWEGEGCFFWKGARPINKFQIIAKGFTMGPAVILAKILTDMVNAETAENIGNAEQCLLNEEAEPQVELQLPRLTKLPPLQTSSTVETKPWKGSAVSKRKRQRGLPNKTPLGAYA
jgi:hypothetical protein